MDTSSTTSRVSGLVFGNVNGRASAIVRVNGAELRVRGLRNGDHIELTNGVDTLTLTRVNRASPKHPAAYGTLVAGGASFAVAAFANQLEDGTKVLGLTESSLPAGEDIDW